MSFHVVEFQDGLHVIPFSWLSDNNQQAFWPPYQDTIRLCKAIINMESPITDDWQLFDILDDLGSADNYPDATAKLKLMQDASDLENFASGEALKKSRARRHRILPISPDTSDDGKQGTEPESEYKNRDARKATSGHGKEQISMPKKPANFVTVTNKDTTITNIEQQVTQNHPHTNVKPRIVSYQVIVAGDKAAKKNALQCPIGDEPVAGNGIRYRTSDKTVEVGQNPSVNSIEAFDEDVLKPSDVKETHIELLHVVSKIYNTVNEIDKRVKSIEDMLNAKPLQTQVADNEEAKQDALEDSLPLGSILEFDEFEKNLREKEFASRVVHFMRTIGGNNTHDFISNVLKRCLANSIAMQYSMEGKKKKIPLRPTAFLKTLIKAAKLHRPKVDEDEIKKSVSAWFAGAKLRFTRETSKQPVPHEVRLDDE